MDATCKQIIHLSTHFPLVLSISNSLHPLAECRSDPVRQRFFWAPPEDGAKPIPHSTALLTIAPDDRMYVENKEWLKLRVVEERFEDTEENMGKLIVKAIPGALVAAVAPGTGGAAMAIASALKSPYSITVRFFIAST
jgi:hypothetical protein